jgi:hypothetical protein
VIGKAVSLDLASNIAMIFGLEKEEIPEKTGARFSAFLNLGSQNKFSSSD